MSWPARVGWALSLLVLFGLVALFAFAPIFSVDFFWHLKLGQLIAAEHRLPDTDLFSAVHPDRTYIQFQWLWDVLAYAAYAVGALRGVRIFQVAVLLASYGMLYRVAIRAFGHRAFAMAYCALGLVWFEDRFQARPSSTVLGMLALALPPMMDEHPTRTRRELALLTLLGCIWSNLHSGEAMLLPLCLGARAVGFSLSRQDPQRARAAWIRTCACTVGVLLSPVLVPGVASWLQTIGPQLRSGNREWLPSYSMLTYGWSPSHVLIAFGPTLVLVAYLVEQGTTWRRSQSRAAPFTPPWAEWLLISGLLVLAHQAVRNVFLALVPIAFMIRRHAAHARARADVVAIATGVLLLVAAAHNHVFEGYGGLAEARFALARDLAPNSFPEELATFMREAQIEGGVLNDGRWGGYLIWEVWPRCSIFADSRHDLTDEMWPVFLGSMSLERRPDVMNHAFRRWGIELAVFRGPTFPAIRETGAWQLLYKAGDQELYQHRQGRHARDNQMRADRWLAVQATILDLPSDIRALGLATGVGAVRWLAAPYQRFRLSRARGMRASPEVSTRIRGIAIEADLLYDAGRFDEALTMLRRVLALDPTDVAARYRATLASYALGRETEALSHFVQLRVRATALSKHQLERLAVLSRRLKQ